MDNNHYFLHHTILSDNHTIITLMILNKVMKLIIRNGNVTIFCQHLYQHTIFIDRIAQ